jgi:hypothetical protein
MTTLRTPKGGAILETGERPMRRAVALRTVPRRTGSAAPFTGRRGMNGIRGRPLPRAGLAMELVNFPTDVVWCQ